MGGRRRLAFLDQIVRPVIDNDLRSQINSFRCAELVSSCALVRITLPERVQEAVDRAQAAFAQVSEAQAKVATAKAEAAANKARQDGYNKCPTCARIEELKALPQGITVYAPGNPNGALLPRR